MPPVLPRLLRHYILIKVWRNRQGGGQGRGVPPRDFWAGNFWWRIGKKEARKKGKRGEKWEEKKENCKKKKGRWNSYKNEERTFFFFAFHFWKRRKFVLGLPKWEFSTGKKISRREKNQEKWLCPLRKICLFNTPLSEWNYEHR